MRLFDDKVENLVRVCHEGTPNLVRVCHEGTPNRGVKIAIAH